MALTSRRSKGVIIVAAAIVMGTLTDRVPERSPLRAGEYFVLAGDFHVHAFPGDGALAPWTLRQEAARAGLDVYTISNHNRTFTARFAQWLARSSRGPIVIAGQEITNPRYHMIAVGIERTVNADQPAAGAIADVHAQGGVAIAAHPAPSFHGYDDDGTVAALDGAEAAHPVDSSGDRQLFAAFYERARKLNPRVAAIGSSDFHTGPELASCRTFVFAREASAAGVIDAIRNGRTVAQDDQGNRHGDPALVAMLERATPPGRMDDRASLRGLSVLFAWFGVLAMLIL